ncbi:DUF2975 domain-containing protein [Alkalibaculum bacchi]|uniref:DUF2975 domain-containing protein n=1 Tax=Alkalibaculum bacchi TaxID=645887 RepID=UPI001474A6DE|nr:DUF2975 domain-containing protein [Alkalibaculum bacchi]
MKTDIASNILKILLILFALGAIFLGIYVLPVMAEEMVVIYPELRYTKLPILIICELLLGLLLIGIGIVMYLLKTFDRGKTFSLTFTRGLEVLIGMCIIASMGILFLLKYMNTFGGPGPLLSLIMIGVIFLVWIIAAVIMLIRSIVKKAMIYKDDYDLTV